VPLQSSVADRIHQVTDAYTNWFIVEDDTGPELTIVDTGFPRSWNSLLDALSALRRLPSNIEAVVLTHGHFDHMGFARRAHEDLGLPVWAHEKEVPLVAHPWRYEHERGRAYYLLRYPGFRRIFAAMSSAGALFVKGLEHVTTFGSDGTLDVPGHPRIVFTPGHTYGHCALHFQNRGTVIAGDAVVTLDPYTGRRGPRIVARAATANSWMALDSLDALAATDAETVLTGHGPAWREGARLAVERARAAGAG
jgi:glyoxylase-like metal-dependent hydrolase (beta-lactamase superfamily II)